MITKYIVSGAENAKAIHPIAAARLTHKQKMHPILRVIAGMGNQNSANVLDMPQGYFRISGWVSPSLNPRDSSLVLKGLFIPGMDPKGVPRARVLVPDKKSPKWFESHCKFLAGEKSSMKVLVRVTGIVGTNLAFVTPMHDTEIESDNASIQEMQKLSSEVMAFLAGEPPSREESLRVMHLMHHYCAESHDAYVVYHSGGIEQIGSTAKDRRQQDANNSNRMEPKAGDWVSYAVNRFGYLYELSGGHRVALPHTFNEIKEGKIILGEAIQKHVRHNPIGLPELSVDWFNICGYSKEPVNENG